MQQITLKTWAKGFPIPQINFLLLLFKKKSVLNPFVHIHVPPLWKPCTADKADNTDTHVLPHIASERADT